MKTSQHLLWILGLLALAWFLFGRKSTASQSATRPAQGPLIPGAASLGTEREVRDKYDAYVARGGTLTFNDWQRDQLTLRTTAL